MAVSEGFKEFVLEQLSRINELSTRNMFGGISVFAGTFCFGLMDDDRLYFKVDDSNRPDFEAVDMGPFRPFGDDRAMQYYEVPVDVLENRDELGEWAARAIDVAQRSKRKKQRPKSKK